MQQYFIIHRFRLNCASAMMRVGVLVACATLLGEDACAGETCNRWTDLDGGFSGSVLTLTAEAGTLIAGGSFPFSTAGATLSSIGSWDGTAWQPYVANSMAGANSNIYAVLGVNDGVIAAGNFNFIGGEFINRVAIWSNSLGEWTNYGSGTNLVAYALTQYNTDLIVGGAFGSAGGGTVNQVARWNGSAWQALGSPPTVGTNGSVLSLVVYNGELIVGGEFSAAGGITANRIARWDGGSGWNVFDDNGNIGLGPGAARAMTVWNGDLVVGGSFATAGGKTVNNIARWNGSEWIAFDDAGNIGVNGAVQALVPYHKDLVAGGTFTSAGGQTVNYIARWQSDTGQWHSFDVNGNIGVNNWTYALTLHEDCLIAGGNFTTAGGQTVNRVAQWCDCPAEIPGDLVAPFGVVDVNDLFAMLADWGDCEVPCPPTCAADLTDDCMVSVNDLFLLLSNFG